MKQRFLIQAAVSLLLFAVLAPAQTEAERGRRSWQNGPNRGNPPDAQQMLQRHVDRLASQLNLTEIQKPQVAKILGDAAQTAQPLHQQLRDARKSLQAAVKANDIGQIELLSNSIGALTAQVTSIESRAEAQFQATLTPDQKAKLPGRPDMMGGPGFVERRGSPPVSQ